MEYRLIKKLPFESSPEIGYISKECNAEHGLHYWNHNWFKPEEYPEYWEKVEDYVILEMINRSGEIYPLRKNEKLTSYEFNNHTVHKIKRLSDGQIFTVGDYVEGYTHSKRKITGFRFGAGSESNILFAVQGGGFTHIKHLKPVKLLPILTTQDGVDIFPGDECWSCDKIMLNNLGKVDWKNKHPYPHGLYFSTKEAAEEYIKKKNYIVLYMKNCDIVEVKRRSDGCIFKIGDKVSGTLDSTPFEIQGFRVSDDGSLYVSQKNRFIKIRVYYTSTSIKRKLHQRRS